MQPTQPYAISNEYNVTEVLANFDSDYVFDMLEDKIANIDYSSTIIDSNLVASFEANFKMMQENFPGDGQNIRLKREEVYREIIDVLCKKFNLRFNSIDENIDVYSAAFWLYDFLICNRNTNMIKFFTSFIINNCDNLYNSLNLDAYKKQKDSSSVYSKKIFSDENQKYAIISSNLDKVFNFICNLDVRLVNIFQSIYINPQQVQFLDNAFADNGNFFRDHYCSVMHLPDAFPVIITSIRLELHRLVGTPIDIYTSN